jgi:hypothetical protein
MTVIARDSVAADHLVYAWPFPLGPECEVSCNDDEQVVMCPSWLVGDRLGPGRHRWRTPDPMRPVSAFFVLTSPVEAPFDMLTSFIIPMTGQPVRLRAVGSILVRCADPGLLIAQFVGLPFDSVNDGILRSVARSVERMLARLLTRRVVLAATPYAVTDPSMLGQIVEELIAYNPTAGAVFGVELIRMGHLAIGADDGSSPYIPRPVPISTPPPGYGGHAGHFGEIGSQPDIQLLETSRGRPLSHHDAMVEATPPPGAPPDTAVASGEIVPRTKNKKTEPGMPAPMSIAPPGSSGSALPVAAGAAAGGVATSGGGAAGAATAAGEIGASAGAGAAGAAGAPAAAPGSVGKSTGPAEVLRAPDETTEPGIKTPLPGAVTIPKLPPVPPPVPPPLPRPGPPRPATPPAEGQGAILGIGTGAIGGRIGEVSGEIPIKIAPGQRVLVPGPNGLMQSATVRQLLQGYYELEVGSSGQTIWVPINGVVPE